MIEKAKKKGWLLLLREVSTTSILGIGVGLSQLNQIVIGMTDTVMMGYFGSEALAAGALVNSLLLLLFLFFTGVLQAAAPIMGTALGQLRLRDISTILNHGYYLAFAMTAIMVVLALLMEPIMLFFGQQEQVVAIAKTYAWLLIPGFLPLLLLVVMRVFLTTLGDVVLLGVVSLVGVFVNGLGNYVFMFGAFGMDAFGIVGCALSTSVTNILMVIVLALLMCLGSKKARVVFWSKSQDFKPLLIRTLLSLGIPIGFVLFSEYVIFAGAGLFMGVLGTNELAAFSITMQWVAVFYMLPVGFSHAATTRVSLAVGKKNLELIKQVFIASIGLTVFYGLTCLVAIYMFNEPLVRLLLKNELEQNLVVVKQATVFMKWAAALQFVNGLIVVCAGIMRGFRETRSPMLLVFIFYWVLGLGSVVLLGTIFGAIGIWAGFLISFSATLLGIILTLLSQIKILPTLLSQISADDGKVFGSSEKNR